MNNRKRKLIHHVFNTTAIWGFILLLGTAGASDFNTISFRRAVLQAFIGLALFIIGIIFGGRDENG